MKLDFDLLFGRRLLTFIHILFPDFKSTTTLLVFLLLIIAILDQIATYFIGILPSEFLVILGKRDNYNFKYLVFKATIFIIFKAFILSLVKYLSSLLYIKCRENFNYIIHRFYFKRHGFYRLNAIGQNIDNPDQRMTQDIEKATRIFCTDLLCPIILSPLIIIYYSYLTFISAGWMAPVSIYIYFIIATLTNKILISPIVSLTNEQEKREGDFRLKHVEVRCNTESIAFYQSGLLENVLANQKLRKLIKTQKELVYKRFILNFITNTFNYFGGTLSYLIIGIPVFLTKSYDNLTIDELTALVSKNAFFYIYLIHAFTNLISLSDNLGALAGVTHRVVELFEELRRLHEDRLETERPPSTVPSSIVILASKDKQKSHVFKKLNCTKKQDVVVESGLKKIEQLHGKQIKNIIDADSDNEEAECLLDELHVSNLLDNGRERLPNDPFGSFSDNETVLKFDHVTISSHFDNSTTLVHGLSINLISGKNLLITGDSSIGKTSILRVMAGLWSPSSGKVDRLWKIKPSTFFFTPQKTYFPFGGLTLRQQIVYPLKALSVENDIPQFQYILKSLHLTNLQNRCGGFDNPIDFDLNENLSPGELQRLAIARVLYHKPKFAFLDESTSAVGLEMETIIYKLLLEFNINFVSVGHRNSLRQFHDKELKLLSNGNWKTSDIDSVSISSSGKSFIGSNSILAI
ncbi:ATP-binding cassette sub-family D member 4 [Strongyloides ratti]|uniref:ATP-binding cassette sub-family D member 4 n=1 Tax=Strongyloides ratti TaxID=34506 RepID=A0A090L1G5_STRRB|nr:ATP-binding cassette sub-family D member 4 [Strongyloides ratti]CEF61304.1 ATP-binding cassette sub-family D member 4 [Strongyloides ratti]